MPGLSINIDDLIQADAFEDIRREFKASWDANTKDSVIRTIAAFATDFPNLNGGYVILGIETGVAGKPVLPPRGLEGQDLELIQKEIRGRCNRIDPLYWPLMQTMRYQNKSILILFAPAGETPPYTAPKRGDGADRGYFVRLSGETLEAKEDLLRQLLEKTARTPFDDRRNLGAKVEDISPTLVRKFLSDIRSGLVVDGISMDDREIYRRMGLVSKVNNHAAPRNIALLFFNETPERFFRGARIEIAQFTDGAGGELIEEKSIVGPLPAQIHTALNYLNSLAETMVRKIPMRAEVDRTVAFPYEAMEEALVNAVYHRSYDEATVEPVKVYLYPDRLEIISYPGPVPGISREGLASVRGAPPAPAQNRRIGELLKELRLAEARGTGIPKIRRRMKENGSPEPVFEFDDARTWFRVTLPAHPQYFLLQALREGARLWGFGERSQAIEYLKQAFESRNGSGALAGQIMDYAFSTDEPGLAKSIFEAFQREPLKSEASLPYLRYAKGLLDLSHTEQANAILNSIPGVWNAIDVVEAAILHKRARDYPKAHQLFQQASASWNNDPKFLHEFAQTKMELSGQHRRKGDHANRMKLLSEADELLRRAIHLATDDTRKAWCYVDLAKLLDWLKEPVAIIEESYIRAQALRPGDPAIETAYHRWQARRK